MRKRIRLKIDGSTFNMAPCFWETLEKQLSEKYIIEYTNDPDYYICNCFTNDYMKKDCIVIQVCGENTTPDFNVVDYAIGHDHMIFGDRYLRFPIFFYWKEDYKDALTKHLRTDDYYLAKEKFCNFIYSSKWRNVIRDEFFMNLSTYKRVDSGGRTLNNIGRLVDDKRLFQENYKFSIAFENSLKDGYTTEKIIQAFSAGTIPIYWGNPSVVKDFNPKSFINLHDFNNVEECIDRIKEIDTSQELYLEMQHEPIYADGTSVSEFIKNPNYLFDFLDHIFEQPMENAKRILNKKNGYNSHYRAIVSRGWWITLLVKKPVRFIRNMIKK